ncbi:MAG: RNA polymerase sigma factor [Cyclobacteriaceae bacterium]
MKDVEIIRKIETGDESALDYLYKKNYTMVVSLIKKNSGTEEEAKDIFQDALLVFWQKIIQHDIVLTSKISTYLYSVCFNLWRKELDRKKKLSYEEKEGSESYDTDQYERKKIVRNCINKMNTTCRKVLMYYYFDGLSMHDIADKMGFSTADTAKTKKYKCKKELDKRIKETYSASDFLD